MGVYTLIYISPVAAFILALQAGFSIPESRQVVCIAKFESRFKIRSSNTNKNRSKDHGLMQINDLWVPTHCSDLDLYNAQDNMSCAYRVYKASKRSFEPWVAYKKHRKLCTKYYDIEKE